MCGEAAEPSVFVRRSGVRMKGPEAAQLIAHYETREGGIDMGVLCVF